MQRFTNAIKYEFVKLGFGVIVQFDVLFYSSFELVEILFDFFFLLLSKDIHPIAHYGDKYVLSVYLRGTEIYIRFPKYIIIQNGYVLKEIFI